MFYAKLFKSDLIFTLIFAVWLHLSLLLLNEVIFIPISMKIYKKMTWLPKFYILIHSENQTTFFFSMQTVQSILTMGYSWQNGMEMLVVD